MLKRRECRWSLGAPGLSGALPAIAQGIRVPKVANTAGVNDPQPCCITAGQHPQLDVHVDFGPAAPGLFANASLDVAIDLHGGCLPRKPRQGPQEPQAGRGTGRPDRLFSNELIDDIKAFDKQAVIQMARNVKA